jgi:hypothetical protein
MRMLLLAWSTIADASAIGDIAAYSIRSPPLPLHLMGGRFHCIPGTASSLTPQSRRFWHFACVGIPVRYRSTLEPRDFDVTPEQPSFLVGRGKATYMTCPADIYFRSREGAWPGNLDTELSSTIIDWLNSHLALQFQAAGLSSCRLSSSWASSRRPGEYRYAPLDAGLLAAARASSTRRNVPRRQSQDFELGHSQAVSFSMRRSPKKTDATLTEVNVTNTLRPFSHEPYFGEGRS